MAIVYLSILATILYIFWISQEENNTSSNYEVIKNRKELKDDQFNSLKNLFAKNSYKSEDIKFENKSIKLYYLDKYQPYKNGKNKNFDAFSSKILSFKNGDPKANDYFFQRLSKTFQKIEDPIQLFCVPSHSPAKTSQITNLIKRLVSVHEYQYFLTDNSGKLKRVDMVNRLSSGTGKRTLDTHLNSISVSFSGAIKSHNKTFPNNAILIDDVCTTGSSIIACSQILKDHGIQNILHLTLARTASLNP